MFMIQSQHTKSMSQPQHKHIYYRSISLLFWCFTLAKYIFSHFFFKFKYKIFENGINLKSQWIAIARKRDKNLFEIIVKIFGYCGKHETVHWSSSQERFVLMIKLNFFRWQQQQQNEYLFDVIWPFRIVTNVEHLLNCRPIYLSRGHSLCMNWK